ncbi:hypothetical protein DIPPA_27027 [Diplonema papillatum]|nr:hypothetical protein DIPPA_27027 [Diplonema papillatum]
MYMSQGAGKFSGKKARADWSASQRYPQISVQAAAGDGRKRAGPCANKMSPAAKSELATHYQQWCPSSPATAGGGSALAAASDGLYRSNSSILSLPQSPRTISPNSSTFGLDDHTSFSSNESAVSDSFEHPDPSARHARPFAAQKVQRHVGAKPHGQQHTQTHQPGISRYWNEAQSALQALSHHRQPAEPQACRHPRGGKARAEPCQLPPSQYSDLALQFAPAPFSPSSSFARPSPPTSSYPFPSAAPTPAHNRSAGSVASVGGTGYSKTATTYPERVSTPWVRNINLQDGISLGDEVMAFGGFLQPTAAEMCYRDNLRRVLQQAVQTVCVHSTVKLIGSCGIGVALPTSGVDLVVEGWTGDSDAVVHVMHQLVGAGHACSMTPDGNLTSGGRGRVVFAAGVSTERKLVHFLKRRMDSLGSFVRAVTLVVRMILFQSNLDGGEKRGLTGLATAFLVARVASELKAEETDSEAGGKAAAETDEPSDEKAKANRLLKTVLEVYGNWKWRDTPVVHFVTKKPSAQPSNGSFDSTDSAPASPSEDAASGETQREQEVKEPAKESKQALKICLVSPYDERVNIADTCSKELQVSAMLVYTSMAISKWVSPSVSDVEKNTRGVTPLSSVIAHKDLWFRAQALREAAATPAPLSINPAEPGLPRSAYAPVSMYSDSTSED